MADTNDNRDALWGWVLDGSPIGSSDGASSVSLEAASYGAQTASEGVSVATEGVSLPRNSDHAQERMNERDVNGGDIQRAIKYGMYYRAASDARLVIADRKKLVVLVLPRNDNTLITVINCEIDGSPWTRPEQVDAYVKRRGLEELSREEIAQARRRRVKLINARAAPKQRRQLDLEPRTPAVTPAQKEEVDAELRRREIELAEGLPPSTSRAGGEDPPDIAAKKVRGYDVDMSTVKACVDSLPEKGSPNEFDENWLDRQRSPSLDDTVEMYSRSRSEIGAIRNLSKGATIWQSARPAMRSGGVCWMVRPPSATARLTERRRSLSKPCRAARGPPRRESPLRRRAYPSREIPITRRIA